MKLKNAIRNVLNIRKDRNLPAAGPLPQIGSNIVRERLRIRLRYPITAEQWEFFTSHGWRTVDMRTDRRRYVSVPDKVLLKLLDHTAEEREELHARLISIEVKKPGDAKRRESAAIQNARARKSMQGSAPSEETEEATV